MGFLRRYKKFFSRQKFLESPSFLYHALYRKDEIPFSGENFHNVTPENFEKQLEELKKKFEIVFLDEVFELIASGKSIKGVCSISFDDAYKSVFTNAVPILETLQVPGTVFLNSGFRQRPFWRDLVRKAIELGVEKDLMKFCNGGLGRDVFSDSSNFYKESKREAKVLSNEIAPLIWQFFEEYHPTVNGEIKGNFAGPELLKDYKFLKIGNHSSDHFFLNQLSKEDQAQQIEDSQKFLDGYDLNRTTCFSLPFGGSRTINQDSIDIMKGMGYESFVLSSGMYSMDFTSRKNEIDLNLNGLLFGNRIMVQDKPVIDLKSIKNG